MPTLSGRAVGRSAATATPVSRTSSRKEARRRADFMSPPVCEFVLVGCRSLLNRPRIRHPLCAPFPDNAAVKNSQLVPADRRGAAVAAGRRRRDTRTSCCRRRPAPASRPACRWRCSPRSRSASGKIVMLEPRRLAARAVATRMAQMLGESVGQTVGFRTRLESRTSKSTRIEVVTEGILTRWLQRDATLEGVAMVIFDEFHERSLNADLGLALCLEAQAEVREDLRILVMSATLDATAVAQLLGNAPVVTAEGKVFPVETRWTAAGVAHARPTRDRHRYANRANDRASARTGTGRHPGVLAGTSGNSPRAAAARRWRSAARRERAAAVRRSVGRGAGRSIAPRRRSASQGRARYQHRRNQPDDRRRARRRRLRARPPRALRSGDGNERPGDGAHLARVRRSTSRARGTPRPGRVLPLVVGKRARFPRRRRPRRKSSKQTSRPSRSSSRSGA